MAEAKTINITNVEQIHAVGAKGPYIKFSIHTDENETFTLFGNPGDTGPRVKGKTVTLTSGDTAKIIFERQGKLTKTLELEVVGKTALNLSPRATTTTLSPTIAVPTTKPPFLAPTNKDISMEVSGLLQAIVHNGQHNGQEEAELIRLLSIKRKVAKSLE